MAQRVEVHLVDDVDGKAAAETITFGLDGATYEIDLSDANAAKLRGALGGWIAKARKVKTVRGAKATPAARNSHRQRDDLGQVREWAAANGYQVSSRGRIPREVAQAYEAAQAS